MSKTLVLDESCFELSLSGGPVHTDLLFATASFRQTSTHDNKLRREPVALICRWFAINSDELAIEISGVTGAFYQPCADDIGMRIKVEACPVLGLQEYKGLPLIAEVGPLQLDPKIDEEVQKNMQSSLICSFPLKIDSIFVSPSSVSPPEILELPGEGILELNNERIMVWFGNNKEKKVMEWEYQELPSVNMVRKSNNLFEVRFNRTQRVKFAAKNNIERDVIGMTIRSITGQKVLEKMQKTSEEFETIDENSLRLHLAEKNIEKDVVNSGTLREEKAEMIEEIKENRHLSLLIPKEHDSQGVNSAKLSYKHRSSTMDYEVLMKLEMLNREMSNEIAEKEKLKQEKENLVERNEILEMKCKEFQENVKKLESSFSCLEREMEENKKKMESFISQKHFYLQEIDIYKAESHSKDEIIDKLKQEMNKLMPSFPNKHKLTWMEVEHLRQALDASNLQIKTLQSENLHLSQNFALSKETNEALLKNQEEMANELNYLRRKCESLAQEKTFMPMTPKKSENSEEYSGKNRNKSGEKIEDEEKMENSVSFLGTGNKRNSQILNDEENKKLRDQIKQMEITIETLKITLSQEVNGKKSGKKLMRMNTMPMKLQTTNGKTINFNCLDVQFLQKLANSLTETIADRELALENQKSINKELIKRLYELEEKLIKSKKTAISQNL